MAAAKSKDKQTNSQRVEVDVEEFIPYACHFNRNTILTKNGELMQVIKITGFTFESVHNTDDEILSLREAIRQAVTESITTNNYALYFHTIRRKRNISTGGEYDTMFCDDLNKAWCSRNNWQNQFVNELYITVMIEGQNLSAKDIKNVLRALHYKKEMRYRLNYLDEKCQELTETTAKILGFLEGYGARLLKMVKQKDGIYYSELSGFLSKIINLKHEPIPVVPIDLSLLLPSHRVLFGYSALEVKGDTGRHFAAMLTIKEYHEIPSGAIDALLQIPQEYIVTESFDFINSKKGLEDFQKMQGYLEATKDKYLSEVSGLNTILASDQGREVDFGEHQLSMMVFEDSLPLLEKGITYAIEAMQRIGVVGFREDIFMEDCYWAQLPGNFVFNKRMTSINTSHIGGYASLYNFPAGKVEDNHWGNAVTVFYTAAKTPYFFNFHYEDNGHTLIVGPYGSGKTVLMNFLVSEAMKFKPRLFFFDQERGAEIFIRAIEGTYHRIAPKSRDRTSLRLNPFALPDSPKNRKFLENWLTSLITSDPLKLSDEDGIKILKAIDYLYTLEPRVRNLSTVLPRFWPIHATPAEAVAIEPALPAETEMPQKSAEDVALESLLGQQQEPTSDALMSMEELAAVSHGLGEMTMEKFAEQEAERKAKEAQAAQQALLEEDDLTAQEQAARDAITTEVKLSQWYGNGEYAHLFDNEEELFDLNETRCIAFDMTQLLEEGMAHVPVTLYLLHCIENCLTGSPAILVLDEAWHLIDNAYFSARVSNWLDELRQKNAMAIFSTEHVKEAEESLLSHLLAQKIETKIFLPNPEADIEGYEGVFGLSDNEFEMLKSMDIRKRQFLLKHNIDAVVAELNLGGMYYECAVLAGSIDNLSIINTIIESTGEDPRTWLPVFKQRLGK